MVYSAVRNSTAPVRNLRCIASRVTAAACATLMLTLSPGFAATKTEKTFGAWLVSCIENGGKKSCSLVKKLQAPKTRRVAFVWAVGVDKQGHYVNSLAVPTGIAVKPGIHLAIGGKDVAVAFRLCTPQVCAASLPMDTATEQALNSGNPIAVKFVLANGRMVKANVDTKNFPDAYSYLKSELGTAAEMAGH